MSRGLSVVAIALVGAVTVLAGSIGLSRGTSDFYVAGRSVSPRRNASALSGEYLSAASFLGVAGLLYDGGVDSLWYPLGYTIGYLVLLVSVAAPLRRSGAYTLPDFAQLRLQSRPVRLLCSALVVGIGLLYLVPQYQSAGLALHNVTGLPAWYGGPGVAAIIAFNVGIGGMRSVTIVQALQYWIKLTAIAVPAFVLIWVWWRHGSPAPAASSAAVGVSVAPGHRLYLTWSTALALGFGTMGLPHVVVRFYTSRNGRDARRTTVGVLGLVGVFYLFPTVYAGLGRVYLPAGHPGETLIFDLPRLMVPGPTGDLLTAMLAGGAFAAFVSTASGLVMATAGVLHQDLVGPVAARVTGADASSIGGFRTSVAVSVIVSLAASAMFAPLGVAVTVTLAFTIAAATFAPLLLLGVWWPRLSATGAIAGLIVGALSGTVTLVAAVSGARTDTWLGALLLRPVAWSLPAALLTSVLVSLVTPGSVPAGAARTMVQLHTPESVLDR